MFVDSSPFVAVVVCIYLLSLASGTWVGVYVSVFINDLPRICFGTAMIDFLSLVFLLYSFVRAGFVFIIFVVFLSLHITVIGVIRLFLFHIPLRGVMLTMLVCSFPLAWPLFVCLLFDCCVCRFADCC